MTLSHAYNLHPYGETSGNYSGFQVCLFFYKGGLFASLGSFSFYLFLDQKEMKESSCFTATISSIAANFHLTNNEESSVYPLQIKKTIPQGKRRAWQDHLYADFSKMTRDSKVRFECFHEKS